MVDEERRLSRRRLMSGVGAGAVMVWVTPVVTRVGLASAAASHEPQPDSFVLSATILPGKGQYLAGFLRTDPTTFLTNVLVTGLSADAVLRGIDFRLSNGLLYGIAEVKGAAELYIIDPVSGAADLQGSLPGLSLLNNEDIGIDFDPITNLLRVVTMRSQNARIDADTLVVTIDTPVAYTSDPQPMVAAAAYTGSGTLYGIDTRRDVLVVQNPPNDGTLTIIGSARTDPRDLNGFDIITIDGRDAAYAAYRTPPPNVAELYAINLSTGAPVLLGPLGTADAAGGPAFKDTVGLALRNPSSSARESVAVLSATSTSLMREGELLVATVSSPSPAIFGEVRFVVDGRSATSPLDAAGRATMTVADLSPGAHSVVAEYLGSSDHEPSGSTELEILV